MPRSPRSVLQRVGLAVSGLRGPQKPLPHPPPPLPLLLQNTLHRRFHTLPLLTPLSIKPQRSSSSKHPIRIPQQLSQPLPRSQTLPLFRHTDHSTKRTTVPIPMSAIFRKSSQPCEKTFPPDYVCAGEEQRHLVTDLTLSPDPFSFCR